MTDALIGSISYENESIKKCHLSSLLSVKLCVISICDYPISDTTWYGDERNWSVMISWELNILFIHVSDSQTKCDQPWKSNKSLKAFKEFQILRLAMQNLSLWSNGLLILLTCVNKWILECNSSIMYVSNLNFCD